TSRAYGAANPANPGFTPVGLAAGDSISSVTYTYQGTATPTANVGTTHTITPSAAVFGSGSAANYSISYLAGTLTISGQASQTISNFNPPANKVYGDAPITLSATGGGSTSPVTFSVVSGPGSVSGTNNSTLTITGAGTIVVQASQAGDINYTAAVNVQASIIVAAKTLTVTANDTSRAYGAANPANPGYTAPGLVGSDSISSVTYSYQATATPTANIGTTHSITPSAAVFGSGSAANYSISYVAGTLTITDGSTGGSFVVSSISGDTDENGTTATFTVALGSQPTGDVTIAVSSSNTDEGVVSPTSLTFTSGDWDTPQTVTVTGVSDSSEDGNQAYTIVLGAATSADSNYSALNPDDVNVTNVDIVGVYSVTPAISAGKTHNLLLANDGSVWGWGSCYYGQLDTGTACDSGATPAYTFNLPQQLNVGKATAISSGVSYSAILSREGTVWTSGLNDNGQLGHAGTTIAPVDGLSGITAISAGYTHMLSVKNDGSVWTWGRGQSGQLGNTLWVASQTPVQAVGALVGRTITSVSSGQNHSLALDNTGLVYAWGGDAYDDLGLGLTTDHTTATPTVIPTLSGVSLIGTGASQSFAVGVVGVNTDGYAWGYNADGQLGISPSTQKGVPTGMTTFTSALLPSKIDGDFMHGVAMTAAGAVYVWGDNENALDQSHSDTFDNRGALGNGTTTDRTSPGTTTAAQWASGTALDVATGNNFTVVLYTDGRVKTSGLNQSAQLGSNEIATSGTTPFTSTPVYVEDPADLGAGSTIPFYAFRPVLSGYPAVSTNNTSASVAVCAAPANCGSITNYMYSTDSGSSWSASTPIATPIALSGLPSGTVNLWVKGLNGATAYQSDSSAVKVSWTVN
ncbi:MAG: hypothetical protein HGA96_16985, partial [Desulfobulbaceae bacterium]|nr:hypothetical protein [Desulfobulbaceae bacterium]